MFYSLSPLAHSPNPPMQLASLSSLPKSPHLVLFPRALKPSYSSSTAAAPSLADSPESRAAHRLGLSQTLQAETLELLEWGSLCKQLSAFTSTSTGFSTAQSASIPFGRSQEESQNLLDQTAAAVEAVTVMGSPPSDFSAIEDLSRIVDAAASGELLTIKELCALRRTLMAARALSEKLKELASSEDCKERYLPLLELLQKCNFQVELEQKIGFCIDCNLSIILDRASDDLEIIRSERKRNMQNLEALLKEVSSQIFRAGGIDSPLVTKRRSRMCVGIRASHRNLLPGSVVLDVSSSGATYFVEPREIVELNNMEVRLSSAEKAEEIAILSLLTSEIAKSKKAIEYLLDKILEVDLAFARAAHALWMNGVRPTFSEISKDLDSHSTDDSIFLDIDKIQHPLLLESSLMSLSDISASNGNDAVWSSGETDLMTRSSSDSRIDFPVPVDIKIGYGTRVVVISGPNTGGKTASMKTLGLASLMSKAGMFLPAKNQPKLPWFNLVLADIGDHQSLEQNLSTFSGHISRIRNILDVTSEESLVLMDEIGGGTDPSEGLALSASILQYLKDRVKLAVVTTHYADLSCLKEKDYRFENAAMEFSLETLRPTYQILWGSSGDSNALNIAKTIGFDQNVIENAQKWMEKLVPEQQQKRKGLLYQSLMDERDRLESQSKRAASLHSKVIELYNEIQDEAEDLDRRETALMVKETLQVQQEVKNAKSQMETVLQEFENQLITASPDQFNSLIKKSESAISSILQVHCPSEARETDTNSYTPEVGEQVHLKGLRDKLATVVEAPADDETVLVQYGKIKVRLKKSDIRAIPSHNKKATASSTPQLKQQLQQSREFQSPSGNSKEGEVSYAPVVQTSKNTVDLRGMRVEEASFYLDMEISTRESGSVLFVIHGMGTGAVKERALEMLRNHPRVANFEQESSMNYGCTIAYIN
ncbi:Endonuclease MutS [Parasponia andersonii]|uniref:Endonuclease MutS n=1 Tax=Parasponia andersonii TaxID=3476 RepID=A0A2P5AJT3_PARAD|nr:Endonuclease MutS [Parasponia andersonii]